MNIRQHITNGVVEIIRRELNSVPEIEMLDKDEHDRTQIAKCLMIFAKFIEQHDDKPNGGLTDSQMLASILERVNTIMSTVTVSHDQFLASLNATNTSVAALVDSTNAYKALVEKLITALDTAINLGTSGTAAPTDFSDVQNVLNSIQSEVSSINDTNAAATAEVNTALQSVSTTVSAPAAAPVTVAATPQITNTTPAPVEASSTASTPAS